MYTPEFLDPADWSDSTDARRMLEFVYPPRSEGTVPDMPRKLRLYLTALGRRQWRDMPWVARVFIRLAEQMADGWRPKPEEYDAIHRLAEHYSVAGRLAHQKNYCADWLRTHGYGTDEPVGRQRYNEDFARLAFVALWRVWPVSPWVPQHLHRTDLIRDIFPPPGQVPFDACWRTDTAVQLAEEMYAVAVFDRMPILADALQDAGCEDTNILSHCRDAEQPHVRGCWVIDQVLQKPA